MVPGAESPLFFIQHFMLDTITKRQGVECAQKKHYGKKNYTQGMTFTVAKQRISKTGSARE